MNKLLERVRLIRKWSEKMDGVLTTGDLKRLFGETDDLKFFRIMKVLESNNIIHQFIRGYYVVDNFNREALAARIYPESYITCTSVLAKVLAIGSIPVNTVYAVKQGRTRTFLSSLCNIVYLGISPHLMFGTYFENGVQYAEPEKAFLDTLYYYQKGQKFSVNIFSDIDLSVLNIEKVKMFLKNYRNPKFISFVEGYINGRISNS